MSNREIVATAPRAPFGEFLRRRRVGAIVEEKFPAVAMRSEYGLGRAVLETRRRRRTAQIRGPIVAFASNGNGGQMHTRSRVPIIPARPAKRRRKSEHDRSARGGRGHVGRRTRTTFSRPGEGSPRAYRNLRRAIEAASSEAELGHVWAHDLRHSATSIMLQHADLATVSRYVEHANVAVTARVLSHAIGSTSEQAPRGAEAMWVRGFGH